MDLGITGRRAILLGSSRGLGRACAESVAREGAHVVINGRTAADVEAAVEELRSSHDVEVSGVVGDSSTAEVHDALLEACPEPDILLLNGEGPPPAPFAGIGPEALDAAFRQAVIGPVGILQRVVSGMVERRFGRVVAVSSAMVKTPNPVMSLSHGTRLGLRQEQMAQLVMQFKGVSYEDARAEQIASIKAGRLGRPEEFGDAFAYLCSAQAGFLSGQSLQLDGGSYEGIF